MDKANTKLIAVVGETGSGKSALAIEIAKRHNGEIISADSRAIFRGMDIGTAKPSKEEMQNIAHYGFDLVDPGERYTAADFKKYADEKIADISGRGKLPIIAGGTGLYVDGVLFDYSFGDDMKDDERSKLSNKTVTELTTIIEQKGIIISQSITKNKRYLIRLIERGGDVIDKQDIAYDALLLGYSISKSALRQRVEKRVEVMFRRGLRKEYNDLRLKYDRNSEAFTGIGYREFADWEDGNASISEVKRAIVKNTMNKLAKHQRTWFKRNPHINWVETEDDALVKVASFLDN